MPSSDDDRGNGDSSGSLFRRTWPWLLLFFVLGFVFALGTTHPIFVGTPVHSISKAFVRGQGGNHTAETIMESQNRTEGTQNEECLLHLLGCDLSCLDWTIVLATGRSGSTTLQQMVAKLPGMNFYGEEGGLMEALNEVQKTIRFASGHGGLSWKGAQDDNATTISCMTQKLYAERHGVQCLHRGCRHGWKEIRYSSPAIVAWIRTVFPASKIVLNYRRVACPPGHRDIHGRSCSQVEKEGNTLKAATASLPNVFHMETEELNNLSKWGELARFVGYEDCEAMNVTSENLKGGYTTMGEEDPTNPWRCRSANLNLPPNR
ncbi:hypothetical protein ACHAXT_001873 [Thalassiosira profunda]